MFAGRVLAWRMKPYKSVSQCYNDRILVPRKKQEASLDVHTYFLPSSNVCQVHSKYNLEMTLGLGNEISSKK